MTHRSDGEEKLVSFTRMSDSTAADYELVDAWSVRFREDVADRVLALYETLKGTTFAHPLDTYDHGLQTATRALRAEADEELVVAALLHDLGVAVSPENHAAASAEILRPYVSEGTYWLVRHHDLFQSYYYLHHYGKDRNARDRHRDHPMYRATVDFCEDWDQCSFDPAYPTEPLATFAPLVRRVFAREPRPAWD